jgi:glycine/D-amino acid oxidase-like deaminating enzyme
VRTQSGTEVLAIEPEAGGGFTVRTSTGTVRARRIINAAGAWAGAVGRLAKVNLPVSGHSLHVMVTEPWPFVLRQMVQHIGRRLTLKQTQYGTFIIGGGWPGRWAPDIDRKKTLWESMVGNLFVAQYVMPSLEGVRVVRSWGGMIGTTPGHMPLIGESSLKGFFVVMGGSAFTSGPVQARLLVELMTTGQPSLPLRLFDPTRFEAAAIN